VDPSGPHTNSPVFDVFNTAYSQIFLYWQKIVPIHFLLNGPVLCCKVCPILYREVLTFQDPTRQARFDYSQFQLPSDASVSSAALQKISLYVSVTCRGCLRRVLAGSAGQQYVSMYKRLRHSVIYISWHWLRARYVIRTQNAISGGVAKNVKGWLLIFTTI
jgi:hypothetical protein